METISINEQVLDKYWTDTIGPLASDPEFSSVKFAFTETVRHLAEPDVRDPNFHMNSRVVDIRVKEHLFQSLATEGIVSVLLQHFGAAEVPGHVLAGIVHVLVGAKRLKIEGDHEAVYLSLTVDEQFQGLQSTEEWYERLPEDLQRNVNKLDFEDIMNQLVYAGFAATKGGKFLLYHRGKHKLGVRVYWDKP